MNWDVFNVAVIGTSLSAGQAWQPVVRSRLQLLTDRPIIFHDFGRPGFSSVQLRDTVGSKPANINPRKLIIECGMNDAGVTLISTFKNQVQDIINMAAGRISMSDILLMTMNPAIAPAPTVTINGCPVIYQGLRDLAASNNCGLIDNHPLWTSPTTTDIPDGVHPTIAALKSYGIISNIVSALSARL